MKMLQITAIVLTIAFTSACGETKSDRALSGGAIGAGAGAAGGALLGTDPLTGAVVGGAAGAITGAATDKDNIDLGDPVWRRK